MATVGEDFQEYGEWLEAQGVDTTGIRTVPGLFTASFFVSTDQANAQIASFYTGAMAHASELHLSDLKQRPALVVISANDPGAMESYARECRETSLPYFYDPGQQVVRLSAEALRQGVQGCHGLFVNDYEFGLIEEKTELTLDAVRECTQMAVITRGVEGADLHTRRGDFHVAAVPPRCIADPTGVGDAFRGGFFKGFLNGIPPERCAQMGALAAAYCLENSGPQGHRFTLQEFIERFRQHFDDGGELDRLT